MLPQTNCTFSLDHCALVLNSKATRSLGRHLPLYMFWCCPSAPATWASQHWTVHIEVGPRSNSTGLPVPRACPKHHPTRAQSLRAMCPVCVCFAHGLSSIEWTFAQSSCPLSPCIYLYMICKGKRNVSCFSSGAKNWHKGFQFPQIEHFKYPCSEPSTSSAQSFSRSPQTFSDPVARSICLRRFSKSTGVSRSSLNCFTFCFDHWLEPWKAAFLLIITIELKSCAISATLWGTYPCLLSIRSKDTCQSERGPTSSTCTPEYAHLPCCCKIRSKRKSQSKSRGIPTFYPGATPSTFHQILHLPTENCGVVGFSPKVAASLGRRNATCRDIGICQGLITRSAARCRLFRRTPQLPRPPRLIR